MIRRKPRRGICDRCGCAVVAPSERDRAVATGEVSGRGCWDRPIMDSGWTSGHQYDDAGKLIRVLCERHLLEYEPWRREWQMYGS